MPSQANPEHETQQREAAWEALRWSNPTCFTLLANYRVAMQNKSAGSNRR